MGDILTDFENSIPPSKPSSYDQRTLCSALQGHKSLFQEKKGHFLFQKKYNVWIYSS